MRSEMRPVLFIVSTLLLFPLIGICAAPPAAQVKTAPISQEVVARDKAFLGILYYERMSSIASEVAGLVEKVTVREGDRVTTGTPLVELNTDLLDTDIALSRTRVKQTALKAEFAAKDFQRQKSLLESRGASQKKYDDALFAHENAKMELKAAEQTLARLLLEKKKSVIAAPFDGIILEKNVDSGNWVKQGGTVLNIGGIDDLFIKVPVDETLLKFMEKGAPVNLTINSTGKKITGTLDALSPKADAKTKNVFVKIRIEPMDNAAENMSATVRLPISEKQKLSIIPRDALIKFQGKDFVYTIKEGKAAILPVNIVTFLGNRVAADNPYLAPGMPVIVEGNERLRPDQPVTVAAE